MAEEKKFEQWVHVKFTERALAEKLDAMAEGDRRDRSKMVRWLIEQEFERRNAGAEVVSASEPVKVVIKGKSSVKAVKMAQKSAVSLLGVSGSAL